MSCSRQESNLHLILRRDVTCPLVRREHGGVLARIRTWNFRFVDGYDCPFHYEDVEPSPGIEPEFPPYRGGVLTAGR